MSSNESSEVFQLKAVISRMHGLAIANLETVMHLYLALANDSNLNPEQKKSVDAAFAGINKQIKTLEEIDILRNIGKKDEPS